MPDKDSEPSPQPGENAGEKGESAQSGGQPVPPEQPPDAFPTQPSVPSPQVPEEHPAGETESLEDLAEDLTRWERHIVEPAEEEEEDGFHRIPPGPTEEIRFE